jgi:hypothetical protein
MTKHRVPRTLGAELREYSAGIYSPAGTWTVTMPRDASVEETVMVSEHEGWHSFITLSTAFGILSSVAAITGIGNGQLAADLVDASTTTHEVLATALGVWKSGYDSAELATVYPGYDDYWACAMEIAPSWPANEVVKHVAVFAFGQVCMQPPVGRKVLERGVENLVIADLPRTLLPDVRFESLMAAFDRGTWQRIDNVASAWLAETERSSLSAELIDDLQNKLYAEFAAVLEDLGYPVLGWQEHLADMRPVVEAAHLAYPEARMLPATVINAADLPADIDTHLRTFGEHVVTLGEAPPAMVHSDASPARVRWWASAEPPHSLTVVRPLRRVLSQYSWNAAGRAAVVRAAHRGISTMIRGRLEGGGVGILPVSTPTVLTFDGRPVPSIVVCSTSALERSEDRIPSSAALPGAIDLMLFDTPPDEWLKHWHDEGLNVRWSGGWILLPQARVYLRVFVPDGGVPWIAFTSPGVALRLHQLAFELWETEYCENPHELLGALESVAVTRVVSEEPWFDFRGSFEYPPRS